MSTTLVRTARDAQAYWLLGGLYEVMLSSAECDGEATLMQITLPAGGAPPPHSHDCSETVFVLRGEVRYHVDGETIPGPAGSVFHVPAHTPEWFEATEESTLLVEYRPGGMDRFFEEAGERATRHEVPPPSDETPDFHHLATLGRRFGLTLLEPPPG